MATHPFLSTEWIDEARRIHEEYRGRTAPVPVVVRVNLIITDVPFGNGNLDAHADTMAGELEIDTGHLEEADTTLTLDYDTARATLVEQDAQAAMSAFMGGRIKVQGDMSKLLLLQGQLGTADPVALEVAGRIRAITSD
ncbi:MAG: hypothetical protein JWN29_2410 [Acidimicrobiales bacterium]|nr:hypothetical protein [Acidimicrobiales bacterium]